MDEQVTTDVPFIKDEVNHLNERWQKLKTDIDTISKNITFLKTAVVQFDDTCRPIEDCFTSVESYLEKDMPATFDMDVLEAYTSELDVQIARLEEQEPTMKSMADQGKEIVDYMEKELGDPSYIKRKVEDTRRKYKNTNDRLVDQRDRSRLQIRQSTEFLALVEDLENWVHVTTTTVTNMGPVSATPDGVKRQISQIDAIQENHEAEGEDRPR
jgi:predicted  nucleic acid-binding Zn-ribbon protein